MLKDIPGTNAMVTADHAFGGVLFFCPAGYRKGDSVSRPPCRKLHCRPDGARNRHTVTVILTRDFEQTVHSADYMNVTHVGSAKVRVASRAVGKGVVFCPPPLHCHHQEC